MYLIAIYIFIFKIVSLASFCRGQIQSKKTDVGSRVHKGFMILLFIIIY